MLHGIAGTSSTWDAVIPRLAENYDVLAPDLLGHGESAKPHGDYSLAAYANAVRDLLEALGENRATLVGHSLGGGIAMQFAYQFLERCERLVLVDSGGLGRAVHPLLRAAALPGAELVLPWLSTATSRGVGALIRGMTRLGIRAGPDLDETWRSFVSLEEPAARRAFIQTVRGVMDLSGQRVSANERLYLTEGLPTLIVWGEDDPLIPVQHGRAAHARIAGSRLEIFPDAGHFPYRDDPGRFASVLTDFIRTTKPLAASANRLGDRLRAGPSKPSSAPSS
ncbi:MAG: alpha/beta hydrolase [Acidobacteriota bacterium]|nr:alpha/beta hydrolase [Acidobacteriota bacterium]